MQVILEGNMVVRLFNKNVKLIVKGVINRKDGPVLTSQELAMLLDRSDLIINTDGAEAPPPNRKRLDHFKVTDLFRFDHVPPLFRKVTKSQESSLFRILTV